MIRVTFYNGHDIPSNFAIIINRNICLKIDTDWYIEQEFFIEHRTDLLNEFVDCFLMPRNCSLDLGEVEYIRSTLEDFLNMKFEIFKTEEYYDYKPEAIIKLMKKPKDPFEEIVL